MMTSRGGALQLVIFGFFPSSLVPPVSSSATLLRAPPTGATCASSLSPPPFRTSIELATMFLRSSRERKKERRKLFMFFVHYHLASSTSFTSHQFHCSKYHLQIIFIFSAPSSPSTDNKQQQSQHQTNDQQKTKYYYYYLPACLITLTPLRKVAILLWNSVSPKRRPLGFGVKEGKQNVTKL